MKLKSMLPAAAALLFTASLAMAAPAAPAAPESAPFLTSAAGPSCAVNASKLPDFAPEPFERAALACGSCSVAACQGMFVGDICAVLPGGRYYTCGVVNTCTAMGGGTGKYCDCPGNY